jgi:hypothetical protein
VSENPEPEENAPEIRQIIWTRIEEGVQTHSPRTSGAVENTTWTVGLVRMDDDEMREEPVIPLS